MDNQSQNPIFHRHTEEIDEIITQIPSWILRWGIVTLGVIILVVILISTFISYPETIKSPVIFVGEKSPNLLIANRPSLVKNVMVRQNETVKKGQQLISIENQGQQSDALTLSSGQDGVVSFINPVYTSMRLRSGQIILKINPKHNELHGLMKISQDNIDKIKLQQNVTIRLTMLLSRYDLVRGKISFIADEPSDDGLFVVQVTLDDSKQSNDLKSWMKGNAEIETQYLTLFQRIFYGAIREPNPAR